MLCASARLETARERERKEKICGQTDYHIIARMGLGCEDFGHTTIYNNAVLSYFHLLDRKRQFCLLCGAGTGKWDDVFQYEFIKTTILLSYAI